MKKSCEKQFSCFHNPFFHETPLIPCPLSSSRVNTHSTPIRTGFYMAYRIIGFQISIRIIIPFVNFESRLIPGCYRILAVLTRIVFVITLQLAERYSLISVRRIVRHYEISVCIDSCKPAITIFSLDIQLLRQLLSGSAIRIYIHRLAIRCLLQYIRKSLVTPFPQTFDNIIIRRDCRKLFLLCLPQKRTGLHKNVGNRIRHASRIYACPHSNYKSQQKRIFYQILSLLLFHLHSSPIIKRIIKIFHFSLL